MAFEHTHPFLLHLWDTIKWPNCIGGVATVVEQYGDGSVMITYQDLDDEPCFDLLKRDEIIYK